MLAFSTEEGPIKTFSLDFLVPIRNLRLKALQDLQLLPRASFRWATGIDLFIVLLCNGRQCYSIILFFLRMCYSIIQHFAEGNSESGTENHRPTFKD